MDWDRVIEKNREALRRILAVLVAMAGLGAFTSPLAGEDGSARRGKAEPSAEPGEGSSRPTLPRHLHRAILRLLRPAESATRRLIVVAARNLVVTLPPPRPRKPIPNPKATHALRRLGIAVVMSGADIARAAAEKRTAEKRAAARAARVPSLPLLDPPQYRFRRRACYVPAHTAPRILSFDGIAPHRLPRPPSRHDPVDAARLRQRLQALASALDDLPGHARRFARWQARRADALAPTLPSMGRVPRPRVWPSASPRTGSAGRVGCAAVRRFSPLRLGRPPGQRPAISRRPAHEVHEVLADLHYFAREALRAPDTS